MWCCCKGWLIHFFVGLSFSEVCLEVGICLTDCWFCIPFFYWVCKNIWIGDDDFADAYYLFRSFRGTMCFVNRRLLINNAEDIPDWIIMGVDVFDCILGSFVQFLVWDVSVHVKKVGCQIYYVDYDDFGAFVDSGHEEIFVYHFSDLIKDIFLNVVGLFSDGDVITVDMDLSCDDWCHDCNFCKQSWSCLAGVLCTWVNYLVCYICKNKSKVTVGYTS